ncbi:hypothetical protein ACOMICROBIO_EPCKBFOG_00347 [Vibrio sp. B1FLJ16]|nr:hypothetical protein ACOMICROBIO_EPCKBFOG_00347 [Vibrio sp. B1FLJ16]CAE6883746.1 hypothetical protein ACOMICROBIO_EPCKBFOG_00347 [Vibrio sp. B1FLJ16]
MALKYFIRELLGLAIVVCVVFGVLGLMLDLFALTAFVEHQDSIARIFFHESLYFIVFFYPAIFSLEAYQSPGLSYCGTRLLGDEN